MRPARHCFFVCDSQDDLLDGEDIAHCPSCSLKVRIIYEDEDLEEYDDATGD
jgi:hypothetical protein